MFIAGGAATWLIKFQICNYGVLWLIAVVAGSWVGGCYSLIALSWDLWLKGSSYRGSSVKYLGEEVVCCSGPVDRCRSLLG